MYKEGQTVARRETGEKILIDSTFQGDQGTIYHAWYLSKEGFEGQFTEAELEPIKHKALKDRLPQMVEQTRSFTRMYAEANAGANWIAATVEDQGNGKLGLLLTAAHNDCEAVRYHKAIIHTMGDYWRAEMLELAAILNADLRRYTIEFCPAVAGVM